MAKLATRLWVLIFHINKEANASLSKICLKCGSSLTKCVKIAHYFWDVEKSPTQNWPWKFAHPSVRNSPTDVWKNRPLFLRCINIAHRKLTLKIRPAKCEKFAHPRVKKSPTIFEMYKYRPSKIDPENSPSQVWEIRPPSCEKIAHYFWDVKKSPIENWPWKFAHPCVRNSPTDVWKNRPLFLRCENIAHRKLTLKIRPPTCDKFAHRRVKIRPLFLRCEKFAHPKWTLKIRPPGCEKFAHRRVKIRPPKIDPENSPTHM